MNYKEYISSLNDVEVDDEKTKLIEVVYSGDLPEIVLKIIANATETIFLDNDKRILSFKEIINVEKELHVAFKNKGILPLVDCGENDFIVYHFKEGIWSKFNIIDEIVFKKKDSFEELIK